MSQVVVIASRELAERRFVFYAAIAFALLAAIMPLVPGLHSDPRDVVGLTSFILAIGLTLGLALSLGVSIVGRDLGAGRMSFYFARPIAAPAIWFGKLAAAAILVAVSFAIVILPALIANQGKVANVPAHSFTEFLVDMAIAAAALFFIAHALSTMIRSRSFLIAVDFLAAAAVGTIFWLLVRPLRETLQASVVMFIGFGVAVLVAFIVAGAWQLASGRADRRRSHVAFSVALWSALAGALGLAGAYVGWIVSATPRDLERLARVQAARRGDWLLVGGKVRHRFDYQPLFLMNAKSGESRRVGSSLWEAGFSADGSKLIELRPIFGPFAEVLIDDVATGRTIETGITAYASGSQMALSDDSSRLAVVDRSILTVYDLAGRRAIASAHMPLPPPIMFFASSDVVRMYTCDGDVLTAFEFDAARRALRKTGAMPAARTAAWRLRLNADGSRLTTLEPGAPSITIRDAGTLQPVDSLAVAHDVFGVVYLHDGRIVTTEAKDARHTVVHVAGTASAVDIGFGNPWLIRDLGDGKVAVTMRSGRSVSIVVVDVDRGLVVRRENDLQLLLPTPMMMADPRAGQPNPNVFVARGNALIRWNALTGEKKVLISG